MTRTAGTCVLDEWKMPRRNLICFTLVSDGREKAIIWFWKFCQSQPNHSGQKECNKNHYKVVSLQIIDSAVIHHHHYWHHIYSELRFFLRRNLTLTPGFRRSWAAEWHRRLGKDDWLTSRYVWSSCLHVYMQSLPNPPTTLLICYTINFWWHTNPPFKKI